MKKTYFIIIMFLVLTIVTIFLISGFKNENFKSFIDYFGKEEESAKEISEPSEQGENFLPNQNTNQDAESSIASNQDAEETEDPECVERKISYSLTNLQVNQTCNQLINNICVDKKVHCALEVKNLNNEIGGIFSIEFEFKTQDTSIEKKVVSASVSSKELKIFESEINIQSEGEEGKANKETICEFSSKEIPTENECP